MVAHEGDRVVDGVRRDRHEDVSRAQKQSVEEHAADGGGQEVRKRRRVE